MGVNHKSHTPLKILAVHRYYWPDTPPYATMLRKIVACWKTAGHQVDVLSSQPSYKVGVANQRRNRIDDVDGSVVYRLNLPNELGRPWRRILNALKLGLAIVCKAVVKRYDVIMVSTSPPVLGGFFSAVAAKITGARFIYHCMDIHPETGRISGEFSHPFVFNLLLTLDQWTCCQENPVVVLSTDMAHSLSSRSATGKLSVTIINNFSLPSVTSASDKPPFDWPRATFTMIFADNIGRFQVLEMVISAMENLVTRTDIHLIVMGEGALKSRLQTQARQLKLNITFVNHQPLAVAKEAIKKSSAGFVGYD